MAFISSVLFFFHGNVYPQEPSQLIGFIENNDKTYLRIELEKINNKWFSICPTTSDIQAVTSCRSESAKGFLNWHVTFSGKAMGKVTTHGYLSPKYYSGVGLAEIAADTIVPRVGERSVEFAGWTSQPIYRPLVGNGKSEALFWVSSYNEDGYVMFYDTLSKHADFTWFYH